MKMSAGFVMAVEKVYRSLEQWRDELGFESVAEKGLLE